MQPIRKAVFPVAGLSTCFLPATKAMPKEMLPVVDKPLIQYAVEEAVAAGITELIFVTGRNKRAIEDHFDSAPELERDLEEESKNELLAVVRDILPSHVSCLYVRQKAMLGLGHAVLTAASAVGNEPFAVLLADDLIDSETSVTKQLIDTAITHGASVLGVQEVPREADQQVRHRRQRPAQRPHRARHAHRREAQASPTRPRRWPWWAATCSNRPSSTTCATRRAAPATRSS